MVCSWLAGNYYYPFLFDTIKFQEKVIPGVCYLHSSMDLIQLHVSGRVWHGPIMIINGNKKPVVSSQLETRFPNECSCSIFLVIRVLKNQGSTNDEPLSSKLLGTLAT
jgi:hypothetical protein